MCCETKETKTNDTCCDPSMFGRMSDCFKGEGSFDCSTIIKEMKNQSCCGPEEKDTKTGCC
jgi:hypothetical protein